MPAWLPTLAAIYSPLSIAAALLVLADIFWLGRRQHMPIMDAVWPLTVLYWGPLGLPFYLWFGRSPPQNQSAHTSHEREPPMWQATFNGAAHCGAGCALGDFIGDWLAFAFGLTLFGSEFGGKVMLGFVLAYLFGIVFQFFAVAPMRGLGLWPGTIAAIKIDTISLLAYEVGMFACMGLRAWLLPDLRPDQWSYWLLMQVAMLVGFATTYPVNWWLITRGTKERM